jgi:ABC-2 type transport system ATP-binding protein
MISVKGVKYKYPSGLFSLLINDFFVGENEKVGLIGLNGSGKSTLLELILDLIPLQAGEIYLNNFKNTSEGWKKFTSAYLSKEFLIDYLSVDEYFEFLMDSNSNHEIVTKLFKELSIESIDKKMLIKNLSEGNKKKVGIAGAILSGSKICILDEPSNYLDFISKEKLANYIKEVEVKTYLIADHDIHFLRKIVDRFIVIKNGEIIKSFVNDEKMQISTLFT